MKFQELVEESAKAIVGYAVDGYENIDGNLVFYSEYIDDYYSNLAHIYNFNPESIKKIEEFFQERNLSPALYEVEEELKGKVNGNYSVVNEDAYMILETPIRVDAKGVKVVEVQTEKEKKEFLDIFNKVFCEGEGVYGGITKGYLKAIENYFKNFPKEKHRDLIARVNGKAAGIVTLILDNNLAIASSLAVLPEYRGRGVSRFLLAELFNPIINKKICTLCTESLSVNEKIYKKIGFKNIGIAKTYLKEVKDG